MNVLIACEFSGTVRDAFTKRGHIAVSCDLLQSETTGLHVVGDVLDLITAAPIGGWDLMIAHPPCTFLCSSGLHWNTKDPDREERTKEAMIFVLNLMGEGFVDNPIPKICLENPVGRIGTAYRPADQYIQPYQFGHDASKKTGLWLKGLPKLRPTAYIAPRDVDGKPRWANQTDSGQNKLGPSETRGQDRSRTYQGIADAMAEQWG